MISSVKALLGMSGLFLLGLSAGAAAEADQSEKAVDTSATVSAGADVAIAEEPKENLLNLAQGGILVSASVDPARALALTDGDHASNWNSSTKKNPLPYTFVFELMADTILTQVGIAGAGERPGGVAGGSAKSIRVEASSTGSDDGYVEIARLEATPDGVTLADVADETPYRWLRFTIEGAQTETPWVYFTEVIAHGAQAAPAEEDRFTGVFKSGRADFIELKQDGGAVTGCYVENSGRSTGQITGSVNDGVALLNWKSDQGITGTALLAIDSSGALNGVRYRQRSRSAWGGPVAGDGTTTPCSEAPPSNPIAEALANDGVALIYGILFEYDSDVPKASSAAALNQLLEALNNAQDLVVTIQGHTDSDGEDAYNLSLSERRAKTVVNWLIENGIASDRLAPEGKGESQPVASNDTADGKALNRRVEVRNTK